MFKKMWRGFFGDDDPRLVLGFSIPWTAWMVWMFVQHI